MCICVQTCALFQHRGAFAGTAIVAENIRCQFIIAGTRLSLCPIFNTYRKTDEK